MVQRTFLAQKNQKIFLKFFDLFQKQDKKYVDFLAYSILRIIFYKSNFSKQTTTFLNSLRFNLQLLKKSFFMNLDKKSLKNRFFIKPIIFGLT